MSLMVLIFSNFMYPRHTKNMPRNRWRFACGFLHKKNTCYLNFLLFMPCLHRRFGSRLTNSYHNIMVKRMKKKNLEAKSYMDRLGGLQQSLCHLDLIIMQNFYLQFSKDHANVFLCNKGRRSQTMELRTKSENYQPVVMDGLKAYLLRSYQRKQ